MAGSTTRRYISINPQSRENSEELHLTNPRNQISGQISIINPATKELENIANIFFNKEDGHQIAESIKESVKEELQGEYITSQDADSRFVSKEDAEDFALRSELEGLASEDQVQATVQAAMGEVEETYLKKVTAEQLATKEELQSTEQSIESSIQQTYLSIEDASRTYLSQTDAANLASKSEVASAKQEVLGQVDGTYAKKEDVQDIVKKADFSEIAKIDTESEYTLADVVAKINEILAAFRSTGGGGGEDEGGQSGGNEPTVNPDPGEGGGEEGGEGGEGTGGNDEPTTGDEPSNPETPTQPDRDPAKTRVIYTETSGYPGTDRNIVGELTKNSIPYQSYVESVDIGNTVTSIGNQAFYCCYGLKNIIIPNSVTNIGYMSFNGCYFLSNIIIPNSVITIGGYAFSGCSITTITIPYSVTSIGEQALACNELISITVDENNLNYKSVNGLLLTKDGKTLIRGVNGDITIPNGVITIQERAFSGCSGVTSMIIPNSVTTIGNEAFYKCSFTDITIPSSVEYIGCQIVNQNFNLTNISILGKPTFENGALGGSGHIFSIYVPEFTMDEVQNNAVDWGLHIGCVANCKDGTFTLS